MATAVALKAQSSDNISYQAVVRNAQNELLVNQKVAVAISILQGSAEGTNVYAETHTPSTNANGLITFLIGNGAATSGDFSAINWSAGPYFIKTEIDPAGGSNFTITSINQLLSVPYALHAKTAESITGDVNYTETDPVFSQSLAAGITESDISKWNHTSYEVGDQLHGGIVFYVDESGQHGLICAKEDQSSGIAWQFGSPSITGAQCIGIGGGYMNTMLIIAAQRGDYEDNYAAKVCASYYTYINDTVYGGWYLPNVTELQLIQSNKAAINTTAATMGGSALIEGEYWSSKEGGLTTDGNAQTVYMMGATGGSLKTDLKAVRAIKAF
ncbi:hypothetical protein C9994_11930 [Marivirga lumbricoides]|uniref:DUF1566 domain-containing protein n=1 Tax=Marivirga lumbricoides TaxID=1046115 RepID=A0A2T4DLF9_9BACT|nr:hypothetical protein C9994_11930 [Marivirga lumbricoides]